MTPANESLNKPAAYYASGSYNGKGPSLAQALREYFHE